MSAETFLNGSSAQFSSARLFEQIDVANCLVDKSAQGNQRVPCAQRRSTRKVWPSGRQIGLVGGSDALTSLARTNLSNSSAVFTEVGGDIVLPVAARDHAFGNGNFVFGQSHCRSPLNRDEKSQTGIGETALEGASA